jgi:hypothetical protein
VRLRVLDEAECYARCYGDHADSVQIIEFVPRRERFETTLTGEEVRRLFELRLDAREPEIQAEAAAA